MTDFQISELLMCPRDDDGVRIETRKEPTPEMTFREVCYKVWRLRDPNISDALLAERFEATYGGRRPDV